MIKVFIFSLLSITIFAAAAFAKPAKIAKTGSRKPTADEPSSIDMRDARSSKFARILGGKKLVCKPEGRGRRADVFPITISAKKTSEHGTTVVIGTKNGSFSGSGEWQTLEYSKSWMIFRNGDDGWNQLFLNAALDDDADLPFDPANSQPAAIFTFMGGDGALSDTQGLVCELQ